LQTTTSGQLRLPYGLGFDKTLADQILQTKPQPIFGKPAAMDKTSVVAEMTPHTRGAKWAFARVNSLQGQQVKVVGQLMMDNVHWNAKDDCGFFGRRAWLLAFDYLGSASGDAVLCVQASGGCTASSRASDWTSLDQVP